MIAGFSKVTERKISAKLVYVSAITINIFLELILKIILYKYVVPNKKYF